MNRRNKKILYTGIGLTILTTAVIVGRKYFKKIPKVVSDKIARYPKFKEVSSKLGISPVWLYYIIQKESGWNPQAVNVNGGATGLIQFMPATAKGLGTSTAQLLLMDVNGQLDYVYKYLAPFKSRLNNISDLYLSVFYPYAAGKSDSYIIGSEKSMNYAKLVAKQNNPKWDLDKNSVLTKGEFKKAVKQDAKKTYGI